MNRLLKILLLIMAVLNFTNCSSTAEYTYFTCGHNLGKYQNENIIRNSIIELLKLSSRQEGFLVDSIRVQGGVQHFLSKIIYPEIAKRAGVEGIAGAEFIADTSGNAINVKIIKGIGAGCDEALLTAIHNQKFVYQSNFSDRFNEKIYLLVRFKLSN